MIAFLFATNIWLNSLLDNFCMYIFIEHESYYRNWASLFSWDLKWSKTEINLLFTLFLIFGLLNLLIHSWSQCQPIFLYHFNFIRFIPAWGKGNNCTLWRNWAAFFHCCMLTRNHLFICCHCCCYCWQLD